MHDQTVSDRLTPGAIALPRGRYFGPCAGRDLALAFEIGGEAVDHFMFCDVGYPVMQARPSPSAAHVVPESWTLMSRHVGRDEMAPLRRSSYVRDLVAPASAIEAWQRPDGSICTVELRRDSAPDALRSLYGPRSIALFLHMNDGSGEGGSNLRFLEERAACTGPYGGEGLLEDLAPRLADGAVVVTDGVLAAEGFRAGRGFALCGIHWEPLGQVGPKSRYGHPPFVWRAHVRAA